MSGRLTSFRWAFTLLFLTSIPACSRPFEIRRGDKERLIRSVSEQTGCEPGHVQLIRLNTAIYQSDGCGTVREYWYSEHSRDWELVSPLRARVREDWDCDSTVVRIRAEEPMVRHVFACDRVGRYALVYAGQRWAWHELASGRTSSDGGTGRGDE